MDSLSKCKYGRDWRGGWKKIASMQFFSMSFLRKLTCFFLQTFDAPSMALLVYIYLVPRNPGKPFNNGLLAIFFAGILHGSSRASGTTLRLGSGTGLFLEHLVCNVKNGKVFFIGSKSTTKKVPQKYYELIIVVGKVVQFL